MIYFRTIEKLCLLLEKLNNGNEEKIRNKQKIWEMIYQKKKRIWAEKLARIVRYNNTQFKKVFSQSISQS